MKAPGLFIAAVKAGLRVVQPGHDLLGAAGRKNRSHLAPTEQLQVVHQTQGRHGPLRCAQSLLAAARLDADKGQPIVRPLAVHESTGSARGLGLLKPMVDHLDQRSGRTEIGLQNIMPPGRGLASLQIALNVGPAETINGLLGVTNQQQCAVAVVGLGLVDAVKDLVLQRRGVLKLVDQGHRMLRQDAGPQTLPVGAAQGRVQPAQHVRKAKAATLPLEQQQPLSNPRCRMQPGGYRQLRQGVDGDLQAGQGGELRRQIQRRGSSRACCLQALGREPLPACAELGFVTGAGALGPGLEGIKPGGVEARPKTFAVPVFLVVGNLRIQPIPHGLCALGPAGFELAQGLVACLAGLQQYLAQRAQAGIGR